MQAEADGHQRHPGEGRGEIQLEPSLRDYTSESRRDPRLKPHGADRRPTARAPARAIPRRCAPCSTPARSCRAAGAPALYSPCRGLQETHPKAGCLAVEHRRLPGKCDHGRRPEKKKRATVLRGGSSRSLRRTEATNPEPHRRLLAQAHHHLRIDQSVHAQPGPESAEQIVRGLLSPDPRSGWKIPLSCARRMAAETDFRHPTDRVLHFLPQILLSHRLDVEEEEDGRAERQAPPVDRMLPSRSCSSAWMPSRVLSTRDECSQGSRRARRKPPSSRIPTAAKVHDRSPRWTSLLVGDLPGSWRRRAPPPPRCRRRASQICRRCFDGPTMRGDHPLARVWRQTFRAHPPV